MKKKIHSTRIRRVFSLLSAIVLACGGTAEAQTSIFTYQGRLTDGSSPANDTYEMQFSLFGSEAGSDQVGSTITNASVTTSNGVFTVHLDFSPATPFASGAERWLQIAVRKASGPPGFTTLSPRQQITSSPYSIRTLSASMADSLSPACVGCVSDANVSDSLTIGATSTVSDSALPAQVARLNGAQTITADWVNTAHPWSDNEVSDALTIGAASKVSDDALSLNIVRTSGAIMTGPLNMNNSVITNIGASGTNFSATGGLTLMGGLNVTGNVTASAVGTFGSIKTTAGPITTVTRTVSVNTSLTATDSVVFVNNSGGPVTVTLPPATVDTIGRVYYVFALPGPNPVTVSSAGADTINGTTSITILASYSGVRVLGVNATSWFAHRLEKED